VPHERSSRSIAELSSLVDETDHDDRHVRDWPEIFAGDEILTTAILDRH